MELDHVVPDLVRAVRELVPNALRVEPHYPGEVDRLERVGDDEASGGVRGATADLYRDWYGSMTPARPLHPRQAEAFAVALAAAAEDDE